jgi:hypothetical protein
MSQPLPIRRPLVSAGVTLALATLVSLVVATSSAADPGARLTRGRASPAVGTTATPFTFSVEFQGNGETAASVTALVAGKTVLLVRTAGSGAKGSWSGSSRLPPGSWQVTFRSVSSGGTNPALAGPTVVVGGAPQPTPTATPRVTPLPTPRPTQVPRAPAVTQLPAVVPVVGPTVTPFGVAVADPTDQGSSAGPAGAGSPSPSASPTSGPPATAASGLRVPPEGVVAIGLLGAVAFVAASAERRRRRASADPGAADAPRAAEPPLDEDTIGTIELAPPDPTLEAQGAEGEPHGPPAEPPA